MSQGASLYFIKRMGAGRLTNSPLAVIKWQSRNGSLVCGQSNLQQPAPPIFCPKKQIPPVVVSRSWLMNRTQTLRLGHRFWLYGEAYWLACCLSLLGNFFITSLNFKVLGTQPTAGPPEGACRAGVVNASRKSQILHHKIIHGCLGDF